MRELRVLVDSRADIVRRRTMVINQIKTYTHLWLDHTPGDLTRRPGMTSLTALVDTTDMSNHVRRVLIEMISEMDRLNKRVRGLETTIRELVTPLAPALLEIKGINHVLVEAGRPDRRLRRMNGKSDTLDAENSARAVLAGFATATPKTADGEAEMIHQLKIARDQAVEQRASAMVTMKAILVHAPDALRRETAGKTQISLARQLAALRPRRLEGPEDALRHTLRTLATRWQYLDAEAKELTKMIWSSGLPRNCSSPSASEWTRPRKSSS